jgi:sensor domain CHASE-containing protein
MKSKLIILLVFVLFLLAIQAALAAIYSQQTKQSLEKKKPVVEQTVSTEWDNTFKSLIVTINE